ncbi:MAG: DUF305 domain-containing protein [Anaerolineae bacterium]
MTKWMKRLIGLGALCLLVSAAFTASAQDTVTLDGRAARAEVRFLEGMIDHHQMALDMANDCLGKATTDEVLTFCQGVIDAQTPEIEQMIVWLHDWYHIDYAPVPMTLDSGMDGMSGMSGMSGMGGSEGPFTDPAMSMGMMAGLNRYTGLDYDIAWLESMIDHHDDALHMSIRLLRRDLHPELRDLAVRIIAAQTEEIAHMEAVIDQLSG